MVPGLVVDKEKKTRGFYSTTSEPSAVLTDLVPYSKYKMFMVVANNRFESPPSNTVELNTKEGGEDLGCSPGPDHHSLQGFLNLSTLYMIQYCGRQV